MDYQSFQDEGVYLVGTIEDNSSYLEGDDSLAEEVGLNEKTDTSAFYWKKYCYEMFCYIVLYYKIEIF